DARPVCVLRSIGGCWCGRHQRWLLTMLAGAGAAAARNHGAVLIVAVALEALSQWRRGRLLLPRLGAAFGVALGPLSYFVFWQIRFGEFWAPLDAQRTWQREPTFPLTAVWHALTLTWRYETWWLNDVTVVG